MRLPIPFEVKGRIYDEVDICKPNAGLLAEVGDIAGKGHSFSAISELVKGCIRVDEEKVPSDHIKKMPYVSAEYVALMAVLEISPDDGFEGIYKCPRCGATQIAELAGEDDYRDFVSDLPVGELDAPEDILIDLDSPVEFKSKGELLESVSSFKMRYPSLNDCIKAERKSSDNLQFAIYSMALLGVNEKDVSPSWINSFGILLFKRLSAADLNKVSRAMKKYGLSSVIEKTCTNRDCKKVWKAPVNTSGFFESALQ